MNKELVIIKRDFHGGLLLEGTSENTKIRGLSTVFLAFHLRKTKNKTLENAKLKKSENVKF